MRILVVEDDPPMASVLSRTLRESGYAVDIVGDGNDAVAQGSLGNYDLMILDILLPGIDGFEVSRAIRSAKAATPILMLSARWKSPTGSAGWRTARTTTCPSPLPSKSCGRGSALCCAGGRCPLRSR